MGGSDKHEDDRVQELATLTHGDLLLGHSLGFYFNITERDKTWKNWLAAGIHLGGAIFSGIAAWEHYKEAKRP